MDVGRQQWSLQLQVGWCVSAVLPAGPANSRNMPPVTYRNTVQPRVLGMLWLFRCHEVVALLAP
jgi:hypothetical protein